MIYVYKMWDFWNGYWIQYTSSDREQIEDSDSLFFITEAEIKSVEHPSPTVAICPKKTD
jgi:hypothetical protein